MERSVEAGDSYSETGRNIDQTVVVNADDAAEGFMVSAGTDSPVEGAAYDGAVGGNWEARLPPVDRLYRSKIRLGFFILYLCDEFYLSVFC